MTTRYLLLWLEAPLQSWGHDSKFGRRDTLNFPTKSGVVGLVCCALGYGGEQTEFLAEFAPLKQTILSFVRKNHNGIKTDREPLLRDFHMVGSGYNDKDPWTTLLIPKTEDGKKAVGGGAKMTYRYYLQDATFAVILEVPSDKAETIADALQTPVWDLFLGRKSCVPTDLVYRGVFDSEANAIESALLIADEKALIVDFKVLDGEHEGEVLTLTDVPVCFGEKKVYRDRRVTVI
ncbi:MAG: type I-E CRISPR-associated protein Cas5/CasD [Methylococcales bacterium]|nr:type I-E CRISPR-associated protein Cas5/CasD [Methylococcales bacterium]MDD5753766.1 type I-E CRISPR-associated protein Cas5/CasD [Methylococcales bacterium]